MIKAKDITAAAIILCLSLSACSQEPETAAQYAEEKEPQTQQTGLESRTDNEDLPLTFDIDTTRSVSISVGHSEPRLFEEKSVLTALILKINSLHLNRSEGADFDAFADMVVTAEDGSQKSITVGTIMMSVYVTGTDGVCRESQEKWGVLTITDADANSSVMELFPPAEYSALYTLLYYIYEGEEPHLTEAADLEDSLRIMELQSHAVSAYDRICSTFAYDKTGATIFPDDFGDAYIDTDNVHLVLCLKAPTQETIDRYLSLVGEAAEYITIREVAFSRNELQAIADEMALVFREEGLTWYAYAVDIVENGVRYFAEENDMTAMQEFFAARYPDIPCRIEEGSPITWD